MHFLYANVAIASAHVTKHLVIAHAMCFYN